MLNRNNKLLTAATSGNLEQVKQMITEGADIEAKKTYGNCSLVTPLMLAAWKNHLPIVQELLQHDVNINTLNKNLTTPLGLAAYRGHLAVTQLLVAHGANIMWIDNYNKTALQDAKGKKVIKFLEAADKLFQYTAAGNIDGIRSLGDLAMISCATNNDGHTALTLALNANKTDVAQALLDGGANSTQAITAAIEDNNEIHLAWLLASRGTYSHHTSSGETFYSLAAKQSSTGIIKTLLNHGVDPNVKNKKGETAAMIASRTGQIEIERLLVNTPSLLAHVKHHDLDIVEKFLKLGVDPNYTSPTKENTLIEAIQHVKNSQEDKTLQPSYDNSMIALLIEYGANILHRDQLGNTALFYAMKRGNLELVKILLDRGAWTQNLNSHNDNLLLMACQSQHPEALIYELERRDMLSKNALHHRNTDGDSALMMAIRSGSKTTVRILLRHDALVNHTNSKQESPLLVAARGGHADIVSTLLANGANVNHTDQYGYNALSHTALIDVKTNQMLLSQGAQLKGIGTMIKSLFVKIALLLGLTDVFHLPTHEVIMPTMPIVQTVAAVLAPPTGGAIPVIYTSTSNNSTANFTPRQSSN